MNKKLLASSVALCLAAMAGVASADVQVYARVDTGLKYLHTKDFAGNRDDAFSMASGQYAGSRYGFKGKEKFANGMEVGFKLEANCDSDTGAGFKGGRAFHRDSLIYIKGDLGEFIFGRYGVIDSGNGGYALLNDDFVAFGTGWGDTIGTNEYIMMGLHKRTDNVFTYKSPAVGGVTFYAQGSTKVDQVKATYSDYAEGTSDATRYYALGAKYNGGALKGFVTVSKDDIGKTIRQTSGGDDAYTVSAGVMYDFGFVNLKAAAQYFDQGLDGQVKGAGYALSATAPLAGGTLYGYLGYADAKQTDDNKVKIENYLVSAGYEYKLSKRTLVYVGASFLSQDDPREGKEKAETIEVATGLLLNF